MSEERTPPGMTEVAVRQPPKAAGRLERAARAVGAQVAKVRERSLAKQLSQAPKGKRAALRKEMYAQRRKQKAYKKWGRKQQLLRKRDARAAEKLMKRRARATMRARKKAAKAALKALRRKRQAGGVKAIQHRSRTRAARKAVSWMWAIRKIKQAIASKKAGYTRNRGFTGSGKGGRTGRAGFWS